jgi:oxygen-dependent protoporphyrinogen oxidase
MTRVAVLGGGVSGLASAFFARQALLGASGCVHLVEASERVGGWFLSERVGGAGGPLLERGPHSFRPAGASGRSAVRLLEELGLEEQALATSPSATQRYVRVGGRLEVLPRSLGELFTNPLTRALPWLGLREALLVGRRRAEPGEPDDESVHSFFSRRFSTATAEVLADAMVQGIFAGDTRQLSVRACLPAVADLETRYGSVVRGLALEALVELLPGRGRAAGGAQALPATDKGRALCRATGVSFKDGLQVLTDELARQTFRSTDRLDCRLFLGRESRVLAGADQRAIELADGTHLPADYVLCALPVRRLRAALPVDAARHLDALIANTRWCSVGVVNLVYKDLPRLPRPGFGHLVPSAHGDGVLGMIYDSEVFPGQQPEGCAALTVMMGGAMFPALALLPPEDMIELAAKAARSHLGITAEPSHAAAVTHRDCIPQYGLDHKHEVARARKEIAKDLPHVRLLGNSFDGVGVADSIARARDAVTSLNLACHVPFK